MQRVGNVMHNDFEIVDVGFDTDFVSPVVGAFMRFLCPARLKCGA